MLRFLLMLMIALSLASCRGGVDVPVAPTPTLEVLGNARAGIPQTAEFSSLASEDGKAVADPGEFPAAATMLSLPRHDEVLPANRGDYYVYGELLRSGDCLRVSYADQVDPVATRDGLLVVWPTGFVADDDGETVKVFDLDGSLVASVGQSIRMSGKKVFSAGEWDWTGSPDSCSGPFWLVGDEVSPSKERMGLSVESYDGVLFATSAEQRGPIISNVAQLEGHLRLHDRCLVVESVDVPKGYLVIWPPGFSLEGSGSGLSMLNGGRQVVAKLGDRVLLAGGHSKVGTAYSGECDGQYFKAGRVALAGQ